MLYKNLILYISVFVLFLASCAREDSDSVDQDTIHTRYVIEYNENTDITTARAQFRFGGPTGTILELADDSEINFEGVEMDWKPLLAYYESTFSGNISSGEFDYSNGDNQTFVNQAIVPSLIGFPSDLNTININNSFIVEWDGPVLEDNEFCLVTISGVDTTGEGELFTNYDPGDDSIVLPANDLQEVGVGEADIWIQRESTLPAPQATNEGGVVIGRYIGLKLTDVDFVD